MAAPRFARIRREVHFKALRFAGGARSLIEVRSPRFLERP
jgi:hypothetical protein